LLPSIRVHLFTLSILFASASNSSLDPDSASETLSPGKIDTTSRLLLTNLIMKSLLALIAFLPTLLFAKDDRLILVGASYGKNVLAICDHDGKVLWKYDTAGPQQGHTGHHDLHLLKSGNILFHDTWSKTSEITLGKKIVWEYESRTGNGNEGKNVDVHAFDRLPNGHTVIVESNIGRIIHVDKKGQLHKAIPLGQDGRQSTRLVTLLKNGHYLAAAENPGVVTEYDAEGKIVWEYPTNTRVFSALRLKSGNTLIATGSGNSVIEVNPAKEVVWEISKKIPGTEIELAWTTDLQELPNGNLIIGNCHAGENNPQIFEITRDKKVVWEFNQWDLVGNGLACWEILSPEQSDLVREKLKELTPTTLLKKNP
jgi:outer membrane protein assembly factor BamB